MSPEQMTYVNELIRDLEYLQAIKEENIVEWAPDPPLINILLADLGKGIAKNFYDLNEVEKDRLFRHIEEGMNSKDEELNTAIATGLIEELVKAGHYKKELWLDLQKVLGPESKDYAIAWKNSPY